MNRVRKLTITEHEDLPLATTFPIEADEVSVDFTIGDTKEALWTVGVTFDVWNGLPRIKRVETHDYQSAGN